MKINGIIISHPEKIMYPEAGITKARVAEYYNYIASYLLPYIKNRPLSLLQYPAGITKVGFFHKHAAKHYPSFIQRFDIPTAHHGNIEMIGLSSTQGLIYIAGQNTIELHMALACVNKIKTPDQIIIDLDPSDNDFEKIRQVALITKDVINKHNFACFVKTTGSRGLHIHIPLQPTHEFSVVKPIAKQLAQEIQELCPHLATLEMRKNKRDNRVFIDYLRNDFSATAVAPYSLRANKWAGVATPLHWDEVKNDKGLNAYKYNINNIAKRLESITNPWQDF